MDTCDHYICHTPNDGLMVANEYLAYSKSSQQVQKELYNRKVPLSHFIDGRKGYCTKLLYCPSCGVKINWKELRSLFV